MKARIKPEQLLNLGKGTSESRRHTLGCAIYTDYEAYFTRGTIKNTPWGAYCKQNKRKNNVFVTLERTILEETLEKYKGKTRYSQQGNPLADRYSDDVIHRMYESIFVDIALISMLGNILPDWCWSLNPLLESAICTLKLSRDDLDAYLKEYRDLGDTWLGEIAMGTMVTTLRPNEKMKAEGTKPTASWARSYALDMHTTFLYLYILIRHSDDYANFLVGTSVFYFGSRECLDMPITRALTMAVHGISALSCLDPDYRVTHIKTDNIRYYPSCVESNPDKPIFPMHKFKCYPDSDIKGRYLFYWQNLNTDNTLSTFQKGYSGSIPIDKDDYEHFKTVIYPGFCMMTQTIADDLENTLARLFQLQSVYSTVLESRDKLAEQSSLTNKLTQENTILKRSLDKLRTRYMTLESDNNKLKAQLSELKVAQTISQQAEGIIAVDKQKTAQLQQLQTKLAKSKSRIESLEAQAGDTSALTFEIARLRAELSNEKALNAELLREYSDRETQGTAQPKQEQLTKEELELLAKARVYLVVSDFPSLKELRRIMPNSTFTFVPNDRSVILNPSTATDFCLLSTKMMGHTYFYKLKQFYKATPDKLVLAHTIGNLAICRLVLAKCYELGIDKLKR